MFFYFLQLLHIGIELGYVCSNFHTILVTCNVFMQERGMYILLKFTYLEVRVLVFWEVEEVALSEDVLMVLMMLVAVMLWIRMRSRGHGSSRRSRTLG